MLKGVRGAVEISPRQNMKKVKIKEVTINWLEIDENGNPRFQYRNFKDESRARDFVETNLVQRNITNFVEKKKCSFVDEENA